MANGSDSGLSDALRQMAENPPGAQSSSDAQASAGAPAAQPDDAELDSSLVAAEIDDESGEPLAQAAPPSKPRPARSASPAGAPHGLKAFSVPLLITVGFLLLLLGVWAILVLVGMNVWLAHKSGAKAMAAFMLLSWPIGLALIGAAILFYKQIQQHEREKARPNRPNRAGSTRR